ncbi:MAG: hypothetical protein M1822_001348 [Bathelium mastoideum]|nr:MAG: hypothetical protein M1822_001348 [Bathelium mastoideum]
MGLTSKFSFPIPGRFQDASNKRLAPETSLKDANDKANAERFFGLGPTPNQSTYDLKNGSTGLAVSEIGYDERYELSDPAAEKSAWSRIGRALYAKPSSNVLGEGRDKSAKGSSASGATRSVQHQGSSSTLRSYYDAQRSPLLVSQQTSASSSRDMALRKDQSTTVAAPVTAGMQSQGQPRRINIKEDHASSPEKLKRPSRLDMARLAPQVRGNGEKTLSPSQLGPTPSPITGKSEYSSPTVGAGKGPRWGLRSKRSKESIKTTLSQSSASRSIGPEKYDSPKLNVRRPPRGIQHWFEGLDMDDDDDEEGIDEKPDFDDSQSFDPSQKAFKKAPSAALVSKYSSYRPVGARERPTLGREMDDVPENGPQPLESPIIRVESGVINKKKVHPAPQANLNNQSVLSLSSDEEEAAPRPAQTRAQYKVDVNGASGRISRDSAYVNFSVKNPKQQHISLQNEAESVRHSGLTSGSIPIAPPTNHPDHYLAVPQKYWHRKTGHQRNQSQSSSMLEDGEPTPMSSNSSDPYDSQSSTPTQPASPTTTITTVSTVSRRNKESSRMMEVTKEEEALLAMMRRKRAAMAKDSFTEGYRQALAEEQALLEEEAAERKRQTLLAMQKRQREQQTAARSRTRSRTQPVSSPPTESSSHIDFTDIPELMDTSYPPPENRYRTKSRSTSHSSAHSTPGPHIRARSTSRPPSSSSSSIYSQSQPDYPDSPHHPLSSISIASPSLHLFPLPGSLSSPTLLNLAASDASPLDSIMERSDSSTPSATTMDSPLTPDHTVPLPLSITHRASAASTMTATTTTTTASTHTAIERTIRATKPHAVPASRASSQPSLLAIFPQSPRTKPLTGPPATPPPPPPQHQHQQGLGGRAAAAGAGQKKGRGEVVSVQSASSSAPSRTSSVQSYTSVGADVLAAWGALGGWHQDERIRMGQF